MFAVLSDATDGITSALLLASLYGTLRSAIDEARVIATVEKVRSHDASGSVTSEVAFILHVPTVLAWCDETNRSSVRSAAGLRHATTSKPDAAVPDVKSVYREWPTLCGNMHELRRSTEQLSRDLCGAPVSPENMLARLNELNGGLNDLAKGLLILSQGLDGEASGRLGGAVRDVALFHRRKFSGRLRAEAAIVESADSLARLLIGSRLNGNGVPQLQERIAGVLDNLELLLDGAHTDPGWLSHQKIVVKELTSYCDKARSAVDGLKSGANDGNMPGQGVAREARNVGEWARELIGAEVRQRWHNALSAEHSIGNDARGGITTATGVGPVL